MRYQVNSVTAGGDEKPIGKITLLETEQNPDIIARKLVHQRILSGAPSDYFIQKSGGEGEIWEIYHAETDELIGMLVIIGV